MKIAIIGTGYVGLVSGTCFAETGITVTCVDIDEAKISKLNQGIVPIYEPGLETMIENNVEKGRLSFSTDIASSIVDCDAVFIAVGTPPDEDGSADLKYVLSVARDIGRHMQNYLVVVNKSTVPIGTAQKVKQAVQSELDIRKSDLAFDVASNPEFLKEGAAITDFLKPDRIVVGVASERAEKIMERLYKPFLLNGHPLLFMDIPSAEMTKYTANAMLATKISFMNDIANLCEIVGADVNMVRKGIGSDSRIGPKFIYPGIGYGGSCFPKDVKALIKTSLENNYKLEILQAVENVNERQKQVLSAKIFRHFGQNLKGKTIALWGLSFKPQTDDMREAPSLIIIGQLLSAGAKVKAYDPVAIEEARHKLGDKISYADDMYEALIDADALAIITEWPEFRVPNYKIMERLLSKKLIFDGRNIYDPNEMKENGYIYYSIGRKTINP
ncbi:MAG: UDP-glucose/GDP-mannose dehydrogenase family protein [Bacteroidales bacterium]|nr:UDP-glucose/GDP-mannose dehydrogenase family protein [Bacteroidales bacterium]MCB8999848.1 UDP-glucose/GDP-mannose dehydrogenase family protein [Bacteroidales bacterium]MCB9013289.1 UDP-glucose/GDP-mannose dehydrogenase family protein [Bacteroidales bacterium]